MLGVIVKAAAHLLSTRGNRRLCVLTFHRVLPEFDPMRPGEPTAVSFDAQVKLLKSAFNVLRLDRAVALMRENRLPPSAISICFDDGYRDNYEIALPILRGNGVAATFFVATGFLQGGAMFNDIVIEAIRDTRETSVALAWAADRPIDLGSLETKRSAINLILPMLKKQPLEQRNRSVEELNSLLHTRPVQNLMMTAEQVHGLYTAGMEIGGHTVNHPILLSLEDGDADREIAQGRATLQDIIGQPVKSFAYPNGRPGRDYEKKHAKMVERQGFDYAVSTRWATCTASEDRFQLPRVAPWGANAAAFGLRTALTYRDR